MVRADVGFVDRDRRRGRALRLGVSARVFYREELMKLSVQQTTIAVAFAMVAAGAHAELVPARITPAELQWTKMPNGAQRAHMASVRRSATAG